jgi:hypothetical protein
MRAAVLATGFGALFISDFIQFINPKREIRGFFWFDMDIFLFSGFAKIKAISCCSSEILSEPVSWSCQKKVLTERAAWF